MTSNDIYTKNYIVYEIIYLPWENNNEGLPWKYIGSTIRNLDRYFGSVRSKRWRNWWENEIKTNPRNFSKKIICHCLTEDNNILKELEYLIQKDNDAIKSDKYFNLGYATKGFFGSNVSGKNNPNYGNKMSEVQKRRHSIIMTNIINASGHRELLSNIQKEVQARPEVIKRKSDNQKERWKDSIKLQTNSVKSQFKPIRIEFKNVSFLSKKDFELYLKENGLKFYTSIYDNTTQWNIEEYKIYNDAVKYKTKVKFNTLHKIAEYCVGINYVHGIDHSKSIHAASIAKLFDIDEERLCIANFLKRHNKNYREIMAILADIINKINDTENIYLKELV